MMKRAREALASGRQLLVFPEGTRTQTPPLNGFKGNFALMAKQARVPVQTAFIQSDSAYLCRGWPLFRKPAFPIHYRVALGERFPPDDDSGRLRARVEDYMRSALQEPTNRDQAQ
jgi:1-acyl-sn-glycerol-3-phosphate acyltransferase